MVLTVLYAPLNREEHRAFYVAVERKFQLFGGIGHLFVFAEQIVEVDCVEGIGCRCGGEVFSRCEVDGAVVILPYPRHYIIAGEIGIALKLYSEEWKFLSCREVVTVEPQQAFVMIP